MKIEMSSFLFVFFILSFFKVVSEEKNVTFILQHSLKVLLAS